MSDNPSGERGRPKISQEELITELRQLADELGETPTTSDMNDCGEYSLPSYYRQFGSWNDALRAAGLEPNQRWGPIPKEDLIDELHHLADELGAPPTKREMDEHSAFGQSTYQNRFGSWNDALRAAGLEPRRTGGERLSEDELINRLRRLAEELGEVPTSYKMKRHGEYSSGVYCKHFGSWGAALDAAGLKDGDDA